MQWSALLENACQPSAGCHRTGLSRLSSARPPGETARGTSGRGSSSARSATGGLRRCAISTSRTRIKHSPTPRSVCGRPRAGSRSPTGPARCADDVDKGDAGPRRRRRSSRLYSDRFEYDDRRRLSGDPHRAPWPSCGPLSNVSSSSTPTSIGARWPCEVSAWHCCWSRWSDDAGNETTTCMCSSSATTG